MSDSNDKLPDSSQSVTLALIDLLHYVMSSLVLCSSMYTCIRVLKALYSRSAFQSFLSLHLYLYSRMAHALCNIQQIRANLGKGQ